MENKASALSIVILDGLGLALIGAGVGLAHSETLAPEKALALCNAGGLFLVLSLFAVVRVVMHRVGKAAGLALFVVFAGGLAALAASSPLAKLPWINDISTDVEAPPPIALHSPGAAPPIEPPLPAEFVPQIKRAYPDLKPLAVKQPPAAVLEQAAMALTAMPGVSQVHIDRGAGLVQAVQVTPLMRFRDDITVRVKADGAGSRVDVRSRSRVGKSDLGANAARIRHVLAALSKS